VRLGELRSAVRLTQPSLSRAVARLERHGWLHRAGAPGDGRGVLVSVTASGRALLAQGAAVHAQTISELLLDRLTLDEQDLLARALTRVAEGGHSPTVQEHSWQSQPHSA
jgi:DNA-binding MarR family transcriptional regulator